MSGVVSIKAPKAIRDTKDVQRALDSVIRQINAAYMTENEIEATVADNELLAYDSTAGVWKNQTAAEAALLSPVSITAAAAGDYIRHSGANWVDVTVSQIVADITGAMSLGGDWDAGAHQIRAKQFYADVDGATSGFLAGASGDAHLYRGDTNEWWAGVDDKIVTMLESSEEGFITERYNDTASYDATLLFRRAKGSQASPTAVVSGNYLGSLVARGYDGDSYEIAAQIRFVCPNTVSDGVVPGEIHFITADTSGSLHGATRIDESQNTSIGTNKLIGGTFGSETVEFYQGASGEWYTGIDDKLVLRLESLGDTFVHRRANDTAGNDAHILFNRSKGTIASPIDVADGTYLGSLVFEGYEGTPYAIAAQIRAVVDGSVSTGVVPGELRILTADAAGVLGGCARYGADQDYYLGPNAIKWGNDIENSDIVMLRHAADHLYLQDILTVTERLQITGNVAPADGVGVEINYNAGLNLGGMVVYDRDTLTYREMKLNASQIGLWLSNTEKVRLDSNGLSVGANKILFDKDGLGSESVNLYSDTDDELKTDDSLEVAVNLTVGGTVTIGTPTAYALSNVTTDRVLDCDSTSEAELADVLATLIQDLITAGIVVSS